MRIAALMWRPWVIGLGAALLALAPTAARAVPTVDGVLDAEYTKVASSPKDNLLVDPANGIDDPNDPRAKSLDITDVYLSNSGNALYVYVGLPYYSLTQTIGAWDLLMHLGGANDTVTVGPNTADPWNPNIIFAHNPLPNIALKSNARSSATAQDGTGGYAAVHAPSTPGSGWTNAFGDLFFNDHVTGDAASGLVHGYGQTGAEIVYKAGDGTPGNYGAIEMRIPFSVFAVGAVTAPKIGDTLLIQFYDQIREATGPNDIRGPNDAAPFEDSIHQSPFGAVLSAWGTPYTLKDVSTPFDLTGAAFTREITTKDSNHLALTFSDNVGSGVGTLTDYTVTDLTTNATVGVTAAALDTANARRVLLTTAPMAWNHNFRVTVNTLQSANGVTVTAGKNTADFSTPAEPTPVVFHFYDPADLVGQQGTDPNTGKPYQVTLAGSFTTPSWVANDTGTGEIPVNPVAGEAQHYESPTLYITPGRIEYKYRIPALLCGSDCKAWNLLNPSGNRIALIPTQEATFNLYDTMPTDTPVQVTFRLVDAENRAAGKPIYVFGDFNNWPASDPSQALKLEPVAGQPNTYEGTTAINQGYYGYKYVTAVPDTQNPGSYIVDYGLFTDQNLGASITGTGTPLAQTIVNVIGVSIPPAVKALRIAGGLDAAPSDITALDADGDKAITIADAVKLQKG